MTEVLHRPARRVPPPEAPPARPPLLAGVVAALWAVAAGLLLLGLPLLVVWAADSGTGAGAAEAVRAVGLVWLVAHGVEVTTPSGPFGLVPLGLTALPVLLLLRAGGHAAREAAVGTLRAGVEAAAGVALPYALLVAAVAAACRTSAADPDGVHALLAGSVVGLLGAGAGVLRRAPAARAAAADVVPPAVRAVARAGLVAALVLLAAGAVAAGASLAVHAETAAELARGTQAGAVGGVALLLLGVTLVPVAAVWGIAWVVGPGFAVGAGTAVSPFSHALGAVPAFPLAAALPGGPAPGWAAGVLAVPVVAGAAAAWRLPVPPGWRGALVAAATGPVTGLLVAGAAWLAGGPLGDGRLAELGPSPWRTGLAAAGLVALGAAAVPALRAAGARLRP